MKKLIPILTLSFFLGIAWLFAMADEVQKVKQEREYPIAAGVWYPQDGPIPEKPMRYYRARCWPGCHTGSSLGLYPDEHLDDAPIWTTSSMDGSFKHPEITKEK